jgi:hypothetical protein
MSAIDLQHAFPRQHNDHPEQIKAIRSKTPEADTSKVLNHANHHNIALQSQKPSTVAQKQLIIAIVLGQDSGSPRFKAEP